MIDPASQGAVLADQFAGKTAFVTGAARGHGAAVAALLVERGARVYFSDIDEQAGTSRADELGPSATFVKLDVGHEPDWEAAIAMLVEAGEALDVLVNNAGVASYSLLTEMDTVDFIRDLNVDLVGSFLGVKHGGALMAAGAGGSIVNIGSIGAFYGFDIVGSYCSAKAGLMGLTRSAAIELGPAGVRVNLLLPGMIDTGMSRLVREDITEGSRPYEDNVLGRYAGPREIAQAVAFLASDESSFITGAFLVADGGQSIGQRMTGRTMSGRHDLPHSPSRVGSLERTSVSWR
jgi:3alpha(or 20beta)-hydroxysteroid dehydrogenase